MIHPTYGGERPSIFVLPSILIVKYPARLWAFWERQMMRGAREIVSYRRVQTDETVIEVYPDDARRSALACRFMYRMLASRRRSV